MSARTFESDDRTDLWSLLAAGIVAGIVAGFVLHATGRIASVGLLYGVDSVWAGWLAHLIHSVAFAFVFGVVATLPAFRGDADDPVAGAGLGATFGFLLWIVGVAVLLPLWLGLVVGVDRPLPYVHVLSLVALVCYGAVLGGLAPLFREQFGDPAPGSFLGG